MSSLLVISTSLNPHSQSAPLAQKAFNKAQETVKDIKFIDLRDLSLPICNGHDQSCYDHPEVLMLHNAIQEAKGVILAAPIHNYGVSASCKNLFELTSHAHKNILTGTAWKNKVLGFIGFSGTPRSLLAPFPFLNGVFVDAQTILVPPLLMASWDDMTPEGISAHIQERLDALVGKWIDLTRVL